MIFSWQELTDRDLNHLAALLIVCEGVETLKKFVEADACETIVYLQAFFFTGDPASLSHDGEVLGNGRKVSTCDFTDISHTERFFREDLDNTKAGRVSESFDDFDSLIVGWITRFHRLAKLPMTFARSSGGYEKISWSENHEIKKFVRKEV